MFSLILPPIIIVLALGALIIMLARAIRVAEEGGHTVETSDTRKKSRLARAAGHVVEKSRSAQNALVKLAQKRRISAAVEEARMAKTDADPTPDDEASKNLSRMGEIILSYNRGVAEGGEHAPQDPLEATLIKAVEKNPQNVDAYERLGDYYMEHQVFDDARECYKYVLRLNPRHRRAQEAMRNLDRVLE